jgi:hypothetical protein
MRLFTADSGNYDCHHPERFHTIGYFACPHEATAAAQAKVTVGSIYVVEGPRDWLNSESDFYPAQP